MSEHTRHLAINEHPDVVVAGDRDGLLRLALHVDACLQRPVAVVRPVAALRVRRVAQQQACVTGTRRAPDSQLSLP